MSEKNSPVVAISLSMFALAIIFLFMANNIKSDENTSSTCKEYTAGIGSSSEIPDSHDTNYCLDNTNIYPDYSNITPEPEWHRGYSQLVGKYEEFAVRPATLEESYKYIEKHRGYEHCNIGYNCTGYEFVSKDGCEYGIVAVVSIPSDNGWLEIDKALSYKPIKAGGSLVLVATVSRATDFDVKCNGQDWSKIGKLQEK